MMIETLEKNSCDPRKSFETQFKSDIPTELQRTTCGIASLTIALKHLFPENNIDPYGLLIAYIQQGQYNRETLGYLARIRGRAVRIPVAYRLENETPTNYQENAVKLLENLRSVNKSPLERIDNPRGQYQPSFTLANGFDHRGVKTFLKQYPVSVETTENKPLDEIFTEIKNDKCVALISCNHENLGYPLHYKILNSTPSHIPTHVVCAINSTTLGSSDIITFTDPAYLNATDAIQTRTLHSLENAYNNISTIITRTD
jgi:hypothetical protein